jgi:hypothetical protein
MASRSVGCKFTLTSKRSVPLPSGLCFPVIKRILKKLTLNLTEAGEADRSSSAARRRTRRFIACANAVASVSRDGESVMAFGWNCFCMLRKSSG